MKIGQAIKEARRNKGLTQTELGEELGVQKSAVSKWERGKTQNIKTSVLKRLSDVLEITPDALIGNIPDDKEETSPESTLGLVFEEAVLLEYLSCMTQENKDKLMEYAYQLLNEQNKKMVQALARMNRSKKDNDQE